MDSRLGGIETWPRATFEALREREVATVATVPDAGLTALLRQFDRDDACRVVTLTTEQEGIGILLGLHLGGHRAALLMQSSGAGNCVNALSLPIATRTPCLMVVTMRGIWGERNPWQVPMGMALRPVLEAMGARVLQAEAPERVAETVGAAADMAFEGNLVVAALVHQRVIGAKAFAQ